MQASRKWQLNETRRAVIGAFQAERRIVPNFLFDPTTACPICGDLIVI